MVLPSSTVVTMSSSTKDLNNGRQALYSPLYQFLPRLAIHNNVYLLHVPNIGDHSEEIFPVLSQSADPLRCIVACPFIDVRSHEICGQPPLCYYM